jgi:hypothetical protein
MTAQHTPGPWRISDGVSSHVYLIDGRIDGQSSAVAEIVFAHARNPADARLIAAAPDLLAALRDVLRIATAASIGVSGNQPRLDRARAAIAKAEGRS